MRHWKRRARFMDDKNVVKKRVTLAIAFVVGGVSVITPFSSTYAIISSKDDVPLFHLFLCN